MNYSKSMEYLMGHEGYISCIVWIEASAADEKTSWSPNSQSISISSLEAITSACTITSYSIIIIIMSYVFFKLHLPKIVRLCCSWNEFDARYFGVYVLDCLLECLSVCGCRKSGIIYKRNNSVWPQSKEKMLSCTKNRVPMGVVDEF